MLGWSQSHKEMKKTQNSKHNWKRLLKHNWKEINRFGGLILLSLKTCSKPIVINAVFDVSIRIYVILEYDWEFKFKPLHLYWIGFRQVCQDNSMNKE